MLKSIDKFLGKGLEYSLLFEFVFLNLAWILALAVPMAVLVATLMAYGRLSSDNEIAAMRSAAVSYTRLLFPALIFGTVIAGGMMYFNNRVLPDMNHHARLLSSDISRKRPDLDFDIGYFINAIPEYNILLGGRNDEIFMDITIFSNRKGVEKRTITAETGTILTVDDGVVLHLNDGVIHEFTGNNEDYRQIYFNEYKVVIPVDNMVLQRRDSSVRGDREMTYGMIREKIASYSEKINQTRIRIKYRLEKEAGIISPPETTLKEIEEKIAFFNTHLADSLEGDAATLTRATRRLKNLKRGVTSDYSLINSYGNSINKYLVELHKKFSIPFASIIFILIGAPLGMMARKGGFAVSMAFSLGFFIIYWGFLIAGEEFADRGYLSPVISMWLPNLVLGIVGLVLCYRQSLEQRVLNLDFLSLLKLKNGRI